MVVFCYHEFLLPDLTLTSSFFTTQSSHLMMTSPIATTKWKYGCQRFVALLSIIVVVLGAAINPTYATEATVATKVLNGEGEGSPGDDASYEPGKANGRDGTDRSKEVYALDDSTSSHEMMKDLNWVSSSETKTDVH